MNATIERPSTTGVPPTGSVGDDSEGRPPKRPTLNDIVEADHSGNMQHWRARMKKWEKATGTMMGLSLAAILWTLWVALNLEKPAAGETLNVLPLELSITGILLGILLMILTEVPQMQTKETSKMDANARAVIVDDIVSTYGIIIDPADAHLTLHEKRISGLQIGGAVKVQFFSGAFAKSWDQPLRLLGAGLS